MSEKITFKTVRTKNFRSIGNQFIEVDLNSEPSTLICSKDNGAGKSTTTLWALVFALFDSSYGKDSKKPGLVNSRSNKNCVVEVEFETKGSQWLVRRGIKPSVFDIIKDGERVEDEAATKDYQKYLESVLGFSEKIFYYTIGLGPDRFVPFAKMKTTERRNFIEPILDISVISPMNEITKSELKEVRRQSEQINYELDLLESSLSGHKRTLSILLEQKQQKLSNSSEELKSLYTDKSKTELMIDQAIDKIYDLNREIDTTFSTKLEDVKSLLSKFLNRQNDFNNTISNISSIDTCPTCLQKVDEDHKKHISADISTKIETLKSPIEKLISQRDSLLDIQEKNRTILEKISQIESMKTQLESKLMSINSNIRMIESTMNDIDEEERISHEQALISSIEKEVKEKTKSLNEIKSKENEYEAVLLILKDDAVKAEIVKEYIPYINSKINEYLDLMNLYVQISIDEEFDMTMFSPDRKGQTLESLSTGQLRRIDLSVLLAFRDVAREKASVSCNLLILDEVLENLSEQGVSDFMEMWDIKFSDSSTNLFVISQRQSEFEQYFDKTICYQLKDDMTVIV